IAVLAWSPIERVAIIHVSIAQIACARKLAREIGFSVCIVERRAATTVTINKEVICTVGLRNEHGTTDAVHATFAILAAPSQASVFEMGGPIWSGHSYYFGNSNPSVVINESSRKIHYIGNVG